MSYRKIVVDGVTYEYVTGKTHTKIRGLGVFENYPFTKDVPRKCSCGCGEYASAVKASADHDELYVQAILPSSVRKMIESVQK